MQARHVLSLPCTPHPCPQAHRTMLGCCSCLRRDISRMAVDGMPSSSASSRIFLRAIISLVTRSFACDNQHMRSHPTSQHVRSA